MKTLRYDIMDMMEPTKYGVSAEPETFDPGDGYDIIVRIDVYSISYPDTSDLQPNTDALVEKIRYMTGADRLLKTITGIHVSCGTEMSGCHTRDIYGHKADEDIAGVEFGMKFSDKTSCLNALRFLIKLDLATRLKNYARIKATDRDRFSSIQINTRTHKQIFFIFRGTAVDAVRYATDDTEMRDILKNIALDNLKIFCQSVCRKHYSEENFAEGLKNIKKRKL